MFRKVTLRIVLLLATLATLGLTLTPLAGAAPAAVVPVPTVTYPVHFAPGTTTSTVLVNLTPDMPVGYVLNIRAGQTLYVTLSGNVSAGVVGPGGTFLTGMKSQPGPWGVPIVQSGDQTVVVSGDGPGSITFYVPPAFDTTPLPYPFPARPERIRFAPGTTTFTANVTLQSGGSYGYVLGISAGQQLIASTNGIVNLALADANRNLVPAASQVNSVMRWNIPHTGDYVLILTGQGQVSVSMGIPAIGGPVPTPTPMPAGRQRVFFGFGNASATRQALLTPGTSQSYVLGAAAGQTLYLSTIGNASLMLLDPQGRVLALGGTSYGASRAFLPTTGDYTVILTGAGSVTVTFYIPPVAGMGY